ncbi:MAG: hypothetical protein ALECFALPRED_005339 [Alectoria fallacina]|uniref:Paf1-domain-containing protein n=1 Tax=Alectoria fallacina TaxID=1903189 RepID=A0A8H3IYH4_9LECA|nr:MAG: hypothetical protein ALECFALPRED_005339 [Alectoria fallacina]
MSTPQARPSERGYHQDYIARIRYENALPPPPGAPKLLNIPAEGLKYYTSAAFSSRLARQQPLNIEADAELGMPIDLVGMPGIFDGDESSIQAPLATPPVHPRDKNLLRSLAELGKPAFNPAGYSFLRRTEYISSDAKARAEANANAVKNNGKSPAASKARKPIDSSKEDPVNILRSAVKGFDLANPEDAYTGPDTTTNIRGAMQTPAEIDAWKRPKHPSKPDVKLLDTYPLKPDPDAVTDSGAYMITKFAGNPTPATEARDIRMDVGILYPRELAPETYNYEFFLPADETAIQNVMRKLDVNDDACNDASLYTDKAPDGSGVFKFDFLRTYEPGRGSTRGVQQYREVALALHDPELDRQTASTESTARDDGIDPLDKGAYYYPVLSKVQLKPRRNKNLVQLGLASQVMDEEAQKFDGICLTVREPDEGEKAKRATHREHVEPDDESGVDGDS